MRSEHGDSVGGREDTQFLLHLERASMIVNSWPLWKQVMLGGTLHPHDITGGTLGIPTLAHPHQSTDPHVVIQYQGGSS